MFTKKQELLLETFADLSDQLFDSGIISTDSFTGEIGEYYACKLFDLKKAERVTRAFDGISKTGEKYQIKAKIVRNSYNLTLKDLEPNLFDYLVVIYLDSLYNPIKIIRIPSRLLRNNELRITSSIIGAFQEFGVTNLKLPEKSKKVINEFALAYNELEEAGIIRSRRIVGDIGEFYACRRLNLKISDNKNEKGVDAIHSNGLTFEVKTRRVYQSGRRTGEARRLNNLVGKSADFLIVVTLDRAFKCSGMWLIPMNNVVNPKSAHLGIVNNTKGTVNLIPSEISWLKTGDSFRGFGNKLFSRGTVKPKTSSTKKPNKGKTKPNQRNTPFISGPIQNNNIQYTSESFFFNKSTRNAILVAIIISIILYIIGELGK